MADDLVSINKGFHQSSCWGACCVGGASSSAGTMSSHTVGLAPSGDTRIPFTLKIFLCKKSEKILVNPKMMTHPFSFVLRSPSDQMSWYQQVVPKAVPNPPTVYNVAFVSAAIAKFDPEVTWVKT